MGHSVNAAGWGLSCAGTAQTTTHPTAPPLISADLPWIVSGCISRERLVPVEALPPACSTVVWVGGWVGRGGAHFAGRTASALRAGQA